MGIIAWIVLGALAGFIAGSVLGIADITGFNLESLVVAVFGAIVVIFVARLVMGRGASRAV